MRTFTTADLNTKIEDITDAAHREPVLLTRHRKPCFVLMSVEVYEILTQGKASDKRTGFTLETIPDDVADGLLAPADRQKREGCDSDAYGGNRSCYSLPLSLTATSPLKRGDGLKDSAGALTRICLRCLRSRREPR